MSHVYTGAREVREALLYIDPATFSSHPQMGNRSSPERISILAVPIQKHIETSNGHSSRVISCRFAVSCFSNQSAFLCRAASEPYAKQNASIPHSETWQTDRDCDRVTNKRGLDPRTSLIAASGDLGIWFCVNHTAMLLYSLEIRPCIS